LPIKTATMVLMSSTTGNRWTGGVDENSSISSYNNDCSDGRNVLLPILLENISKIPMEPQMSIYH
jgi:hypothetical protein